MTTTDFTSTSSATGSSELPWRMTRDRPSKPLSEARRFSDNMVHILANAGLIENANETKNNFYTYSVPASKHNPMRYLCSIDKYVLVAQAAGHVFTLFKDRPTSSVVMKKVERNELAFYRAVHFGSIEPLLKCWADLFPVADIDRNQLNADLALIKPFIATFSGIEEIEGATCGKLEDFTLEYRFPSVIDFKMGTSTAEAGLTRDRREWTANKDDKTTSASLGVRISGMRHYSPATKMWDVRGKQWGYMKVQANNFSKEGLRSFLPDDPERAKVAAEGILVTLRDLSRALEKQQSLCFCGASLFIVFEGDSNRAPKPKVKLIDFAATYPQIELGDGLPKDRGVGQGVVSLITGFEQVLNRLAERSDAN